MSSPQSSFNARSMAFFQQIQGVDRDAKEIDALISEMLTMGTQWSSEYSEFEAWIEDRKNYQGKIHDVGFASSGEEPRYLNCWEAILYAATKAGLTTHAKLRARCDDAKDSGRLAKQVLNFAGARPLQLLNALPTNVQKGDILFIRGTSHVVVATDNVGNVIQLWSWSGKTRTATLQELLGEMNQGGLDDKIAFLKRLLEDSPEKRKEALEESGLPNYDKVDLHLTDAADNPTYMKTFQRLWDHFCGPLPLRGETSQVMVSTPRWP